MKALPVRFVTKAEGGGGWKQCAKEKATHLFLNFPGNSAFSGLRQIRISRLDGDPKGPCWEWDGNTESPTISPSILNVTGRERCHTFVRAGKVQFLEDCTHALRGQTYDLLDPEELLGPLIFDDEGK